MRYERKYRIEGIPPEWVRQAILLHPASFRTLHPDRRINNIYFDTSDLQAFYENVAGVPHRYKHRLRWYGERMDRLEKATYEIKIKDGEMGGKEKQKIGTVDWSGLRDTFREIPQLRYLPLRPVLVNYYHRSYLATPDERFRITIDHQLHFAPFYWYRHPQPFHFLPDHAVVMELKYEREDDEAARRILSYLPFRQTKNSKYVTGINLIMG
ncbi:MAG: polyphosphate polymerase domain-containing protein [Lewinella sp.]|nr:polyphosphate polymerase domain-containing protein [Lewinella sp.]